MSEVISKAERAAKKMARIPIKIPITTAALPKPDWIKVRLSHSPKVAKLKKILRQHQLVSVCEEASCPNLSECFSNGTATFMIMGAKCTRRCSFCDVAHGRPDPLDQQEPEKIAQAIAALQLNYVVITSVDRDDLRDGGADHFRQCIRAVRDHCPQTKIEILVPDFRGRLDKALNILSQEPVDVFNHNLETVAALYPQARPGSDYQHSLTLLQNYKKQHPTIRTKSGLMLGLGESKQQLYTTLEDLRAHDVDMLTIGQYLAPSMHHYPVKRYIHPDEFEEIKQVSLAMGFTQVASGPMVRSSYHADQQALC